MVEPPSQSTVDAESPTLPAWVATKQGAPLGTPERIAHYRLGRELGRGGMGVVHAAHDEVLEREVAIKLLHANRTDPRAQERMLQEAKALARLSHPNIVPIYGAGEEGGQVYLAMELVEGRSLRELRDEQPNDPREVVRVYLQAARGLAAAHAAGLVHRDFKPSNAFMGSDGRVRVLDFGLARTVGAAGSALQTLESASPASDAMAGTPAYMAPEQRLGLHADARADQYSFCVALWEALFGVNPIRRTPLIDVIEGELVLEVPRERRVPQHVIEALRTGMRRDAQLRHPSMDALIERLADAPKSQWRLPVLGLTAVAAVAGIVAWSDDDRCTELGDPFSDVFGPPQRAAIVRTLGEAGRPTDAIETTMAALDRHAADWTEARRTACEAHRDGQTSATRNEQVLTCLEAKRTAMQAALSTEASIPETVERLSSPRLCLQRDQVGVREPPLPEPGASKARRATRRRVETARAHLQALDLDPLPDMLARLDADVGEDVPMQAEAALLRGQLLRHRAQWLDASRALAEAYELAEASEYRLVAARAAIWLAHVIGDRLARKGEGEVWLTVAQTKVEALDDPELRAKLALARGSMALTHADFDRAANHLETALELARAHWGEPHLEVASVLSAQGSLALQRERPGDAERLYGEAVAMRRRVLGERHPQIADGLANLASVAVARGSFDDAVRGYEEALALAEDSSAPLGTSRAQIELGLADVEARRGNIEAAGRHYEAALASVPRGSESHPLRATILASYAGFDSREGDYAGAVKMAREALAIQGQVFGRKHPSVAVTYNNLGAALMSLERNEEAKRAFETSIAIHRELAGPRSPDIASPLTNLGLLEHAEGNLEVAQTSFEEVLALETEHLGPEHPNLVYDHFYLAQVALADERWDDALEHLERARALRHPAAPVRAEVLVALTQTKASAGRPWQADADATRQALAAMEDPSALETFETWVAEQR